MYPKYQILPFLSIYDYQTYTFIHKALNNTITSNLEYKANSDYHSHNTRTKNNLHLQNIHSNSLGKANIIHNGFKKYNDLPSSYKSLNNVLFKKHIKGFLLDRAYLHFR
jgi:hypothetical protein